MLLAEQPNSVEYLSWWGSILSTLLTGLGLLVSIPGAYWTWKQQRGESRSANPASGKSAAKKRRRNRVATTQTAAKSGPAPSSKGDLPRAGADGGPPTASTTTSAEQSPSRGSSRPRLTALRVLITVSVTLSLAFVSSVVAMVQAGRLLRGISYNQLAAVSGDLPGHRSVDACGSGLCPIVDHWELTGRRRHIEVGYSGLVRADTKQVGRARLTLAAQGCRPGLQIAWQVQVEGRVSASGTAGPEAVTAVLGVKPGERIRMIVDGISADNCTIDVKSSWTVVFAPDDVWKVLKDNLPHGIDRPPLTP